MFEYTGVPVPATVALVAVVGEAILAILALIVIIIRNLYGFLFTPPGLPG